MEVGAAGDILRCVVLCARWAVARRLARKALQKRWQQSRQSLLVVRSGIDFSGWCQLVDDLWHVLRQEARSLSGIYSHFRREGFDLV